MRVTLSDVELLLTHRVDVYLNGCKQEYVIEADDEAGTVKRFIMNDGRVMRQDSVLLTETVRGVVRIETRKKEHWE